MLASHGTRSRPSLKPPFPCSWVPLLLLLAAPALGAELVVYDDAIGPEEASRAARRSLGGSDFTLRPASELARSWSELVVLGHVERIDCTGSLGGFAGMQKQLAAAEAAIDALEPGDALRLLSQVRASLPCAEDFLSPGILSDLSANAARIHEHGERADRIIRSMLGHSRGARGVAEEADLNALLEQAHEEVLAQLDAGPPVEVTRDLAGLSRLEVYAEPIRQVFRNLLENAYFALRARVAEAPAGYQPRLWLATRQVGERVEVRVRDNGGGIPAEMLSEVFEPFFTTKAAGEGTGLGLSISFDIVTQVHLGELLVESVPGEFTEFTILLPRDQASRATLREQILKAPRA